MCEFKVINKEGEKEQKIGEDIVYAKVSDDYVLLKDILGGAIKIHGAIIEEVDVNSEILKLVSSPLIIKINKFLDACHRCDSKKVYDKELEALWEEIKASGDEAVRTLWKKYGKR
ncbi:MAG: CooT family nickel-binding protein [archaeon]|nr:CooT family nickel-binding protein [archaeon]MCP8315004.1 CooT family nickel-binding protein [archaeon]MCP8317017.1 CooT family nickel-binding protein [archaeon]MCP8322443.1 CooT family nickel-binding protein [archaeon]